MHHHLLQSDIFLIQPVISNPTIWNHFLNLVFQLILSVYILIYKCIIVVVVMILFLVPNVCNINYYQLPNSSNNDNN